MKFSAAAFLFWNFIITLGVGAATAYGESILILYLGVIR